MKLTKQEARKVFLLWQGLAGKPRWQNKEGIMQWIAQAGCVQYDPIDICGRNADLVLYSRIKGYQKNQLDELLYQQRKLIDYTDKNMAIFQTSDYPCFQRCRNKKARSSRITKSMILAKEKVNVYLQTHPYVSAKDLKWGETMTWIWGNQASLASVVLEVMYESGELVIHHRQKTIRYYGLSEVYIPSVAHAVDPHPNQQEYYKWALLRRIKAVGMVANRGSDAWLGIESFLQVARREAFKGLLKSGDIIAIEVEQIKDVLYASKEILPWILQVKEQLKLTNRMEFLGPLDNALWDRSIIRQLFDFDYKWEIYTPQTQRKYAAYVLPVLWKDCFVGRIEIKLDKKEKKLVAEHFWKEESYPSSKALYKKLQQKCEEFAHFHDCEQSIVINYEKQL